MTKKLAFIAIFAATLIACKSTPQGGNTAGSEEADDVATVQFDADSTLRLIEAQCQFGPRTPGSNAHRRCGDYIVAQFHERGLEVTEQKAMLTAWDNKQFECRNIIASYLPEQTNRIVLAAHWDSRPWADADPDASKHGQPVMAANDGASGVAVMLQIASLLKELKPSCGIDFICFDLEDYGAPEDAAGSDNHVQDWCLGSQHWASHPHKPGYTARFGILLDMVGSKNARFYHEYSSMRYAQSVVARVWSAAHTAGYGEYFVQEMGGAIEDDHIYMNAAGIPTIDIINTFPTNPSFGPTWHTTHDVPENISTETLKAVGQTLVQFLYEMEKEENPTPQTSSK